LREEVLKLSLEVSSDPGNDGLHVGGDFNDNIASTGVTSRDVCLCAISINSNGSILSQYGIKFTIDKDLVVPLFNSLNNVRGNVNVIQDSTNSDRFQIKVWLPELGEVDSTCYIGTIEQELDTLSKDCLSLVDIIT
jgi:hypothetical protein